MVSAPHLPQGGPWPATPSPAYQAAGWWDVNVNGTTYPRHETEIHFEPEAPGLAPGIDPAYAAWMSTGSD
jgi:hypothetical protein